MTKRCAQRHRSVLVVFIFHARTDRIWPPVLGQLDSRIYRPSKRSSPGTVSFRAFTHALKNQCLPPRVTIVINGEKKLANDLRKISLPPSLHFDPFEEEREEIGRRIVERILAQSIDDPSKFYDRCKTNVAQFASGSRIPSFVPLNYRLALIIAPD